MRKQELVHLHGLFAALRSHLRERDDVTVPDDAFDPYDEYGVGPTALAERKDEHVTALDRLSDGVHETVTTHDPALDDAADGDMAAAPSTQGNRGRESRVPDY